ncbi:MAG: hypothetical protein ACE363_05920 [Alphaproteobacteria bacterium]
MITYPTTLPDARFTTTTFGADFNNITHLSLNRSRQVVSRAGDLLIFEFQLPPKTPAQADAWVAWAMGQRGSFGTFYGFDPDRRTPRGVATGSPLVAGASQSGYSLATDGWTPSVTGILRAGDWIEVGGLLRMVTQDADSSAGGAATLSISPGIGPGQSPADNAPVTVTGAKGIFRLIDDRLTWDSDVIRLQGLSFRAIEVLNV